MKRGLSLLLALSCLVGCFLSLTGCALGANEKTKYTDYSFDFFDTTTTIIGYEVDDVTFAKNCVTIKEALKE